LQQLFEAVRLETGLLVRVGRELDIEPQPGEELLPPR